MTAVEVVLHPVSAGYGGISGSRFSDLFRGHHVGLVDVGVFIAHELFIHFNTVEHIQGHLVFDLVGTAFECEHHASGIKHKAFEISGSGEVSHESFHVIAYVGITGCGLERRGLWWLCQGMMLVFCEFCGCGCWRLISPDVVFCWCDRF